MRGLKLGAMAALVGGLVLLAYAASQGAVRVGFFLIIPFVYATGGVAALGMLLLMAAAVLWSVIAFRTMAPLEPEAHEATTERAVERKSGGVVLLGPIPIVWGSDRRVLPWMVAAGAGLLVLALLLAWSLR